MGSKTENAIEDAMEVAQKNDSWCVKMKSYILDPTKNGWDPEIIHDAPQYSTGGRLFKISRFKPRLYVPLR